ncbi:hypothetical protein DBR47_19450 [Paucibacter sp. KBW04]|uniref:hypothetical protein n=1 Tax=Paucibacter sp. KBW04 TaxID=2153361 RepID=UPI000F57261C|nr:hypothetical protein [Paucibacter sp. KBW04]RQO56036.1 hypothetical protein DBR47_19450 [Paucibacter sp. KBW04]
MRYHSRIDAWLLLLYGAIFALAYSRKLAAAPALSLRRVLIRHGRWSGQLVSARDREGFMQAQQARVTQAQQAQRQTQPPSALQRQVSKDLP